MKSFFKNNASYFSVILLVLASAGISEAQVNWQTRSKKINAKFWEISFVAKVNSPWHIYSQDSPKGGPLATSLTLDKNPFVKVIEKPKEIGNRRKEFLESFGIHVFYYDDSVKFVQRIELNKVIKTKVTGSIKFMVCNENQCMPPDRYDFSIDIK